MFKMRKNLAILFFLFIIFMSLVVSSFMDRFTEGMVSTVTVDDIFDQLKNNENDDFASVAKINGYLSELDDTLKQTIKTRLDEFDTDSIALSDFKDILYEHPEIVKFIEVKVDNFQYKSDDNVSPTTESPGPSPMMESITYSPMMESPSSSPMMESPSSSPSTEPFQTRLTPIPYKKDSPNKISTSNDSLRKQYNSNGVFNRVFEFSSHQQFQLKNP